MSTNKTMSAEEYLKSKRFLPEDHTVEGNSGRVMYVTELLEEYASIKSAEKDKEIQERASQVIEYASKASELEHLLQIKDQQLKEMIEVLERYYYLENGNVSKLNTTPSQRLAIAKQALSNYKKGGSDE